MHGIICGDLHATTESHRKIAKFVTIKNSAILNDNSPMLWHNTHTTIDLTTTLPDIMHQKDDSSHVSILTNITQQKSNKQ